MPTIRSFRTHLFQRAASSRLATSYGQPESERPHVVVELTDEAENTGFGEASPLPFFTGETAESIQLLLERAFLPGLVGSDPLDIAAAHAMMDAALPGNSSAKAAVDMALYDLAARGLGLPEHQLLGGACRRQVAITRPLGIGSISDTVAQAVRYVESGHRTLKLKVGIDARADIERIRTVREAVGPDVALRIDGNQGYDLPTALRVLSALAPLEIQYCEQPLPAWDHAGLATLRSETGVRIAADESLHTVRDAVRLVERRAVDVFVIKLIKTSGLWPALQIAGVAQSAGVVCVAVSPFDTQIGAAHGLHLAAALPTASMACELTVFASQPELATTGHRLADGSVILSGAPGCGVSAIPELESPSVQGGDDRARSA